MVRSETLSFGTRREKDDSGLRERALGQFALRCHQQGDKLSRMKLNLQYPDIDEVSVLKSDIEALKRHDAAIRESAIALLNAAALTWERDAKVQHARYFRLICPEDCREILSERIEELAKCSEPKFRSFLQTAAFRPPTKEQTNPEKSP